MNKDIINEIRSKSDIVDVISSYIPLSKKGRNYFGVCPFHDDTNPSLSVSPERQIYKCFSCGASGNVFSFIMDYEKISFPESVKLLGKKCGVDTGFNIKSRDNIYTKYYDMYDFAASFYQNNLVSSEGKEALEYLKKRKISEEAIKHFKIGLSLSGDNLTKILKAKGYTSIELEEYGLSTGSFDKYQNRIMFPLTSSSGMINAFSGRIYKTSDTAKYVNTQETKIFKKGETLYNYQAAKKEARLKGYLIVCEGFMDVIRFFSKGYKNAVALMGTALTKEQYLLIKAVSPNIYLCLDGDSAGQKASLNIGEEYFKEENLKIITLPGSDDPDTYLMKEDSNFDILMQEALSFYDFKLDYYLNKIDINNENEVHRFVNFMLKDIKEIKDPIKREIALKKLAKSVNLEYNTLDKQIGSVEVIRKKKEVKIVSLDENKYQKAEKYLLKLMMQEEKALNKYLESGINLSSDYNYLASKVISFYKQNDFIKEADFYTSILDDEKALAIYKKLDDHESLKYTEKLAEDLIKAIKEKEESLSIKEIQKRIKEEKDPLTKARLVEDIIRLRIGDKNDKRN